MKRKIALFSTLILASLSSWLATPVVQAQETASKSESSPEEWRKTPPKMPAPRPFKLPNIEKYKLSNGLQVELVEDHRVPFTTLALGLKVGTANDPKDKIGLSALLADMLAEGSDKHNSKELAEAIDFLGGAFMAQAGQDFTIVSASALSQYNERLLSTFSEVLLHPSFPEDELKLKKTNTIQELSMNRSKPDFLANERFSKVVFGDHPYAVVAPEPATIEKISRADLSRYHKQNFLPNCSELVIVGDFKSAEMKALIEKEFADWKPGVADKVQSAALPKSAGKKIFLVDRPESVQSKLKMGNVGIKRSDPDFYALTVANQILGGAATSRLFINIRENKGYTYGAYSKISPQREPGPFSAEAEVRTEVTAQALQEFFYELERMRNLKVTDKELADTKNYLVGSFQLGLETQNGLAQRLLEGQLYELPDDYLESYGQRIVAVGADDVRRVARRYFDLDNLVLTVVGDAGKIKNEIEYFAPVAVYDTDGKEKSGLGSKTAGGN